MSYCGRSKILACGVDSGELSIHFVKSLQNTQSTVGFMTKVHEGPVESISLVKNVICSASSQGSNLRRKFREKLKIKICS